jgi:two-component system, NarL family, nitrate/nitrite response regulator NarL
MDSYHKEILFLIADDHPIFRDGLRSLLDSQEGFRVVGEAADGAEAVRLTKQLTPDILLLDLAMPRYSGLEALRDIARASIPVRTIVLTAAIENAEIVEALQLGARAVVLKESATQVLIQSIRSVMSGQYWVGHESIAGLVQALQELGSSARRDKRRKTFGLTPRELEIVQMIVASSRNKDIAEKFAISEQTVKHHLTNIFNKLGLSTRLELALFAVNHSLVGDSSSHEPSAEVFPPKPLE